MDHPFSALTDSMSRNDSKLVGGTSGQSKLLALLEVLLEKVLAVTEVSILHLQTTLDLITMASGGIGFGLSSV